MKSCIAIYLLRLKDSIYTNKMAFLGQDSPRVRLPGDRHDDRDHIWFKSIFRAQYPGADILHAFERYKADIWSFERSNRPVKSIKYQTGLYQGQIVLKMVGSTPASRPILPNQMPAGFPGVPPTVSLITQAGNPMPAQLGLGFPAVSLPQQHGNQVPVGVSGAHTHQQHSSLNPHTVPSGWGQGASANGGQGLGLPAVSQQQRNQVPVAIPEALAPQQRSSFKPNPRAAPFGPGQGATTNGGQGSTQIRPQPSNSLPALNLTPVSVVTPWVRPASQAGSLWTYSVLTLSPSQMAQNSSGSSSDGDDDNGNDNDRDVGEWISSLNNELSELLNC